MICPVCTHNNLPGAEQCANCLLDLTQLDQPTAQDRVERSLLEDRVGVLKPRPAVTLPPTATVGEAIQTMLARNVGALLVVDDAGKLLGIFSERDLLTKAASDPDYAARPVARVHDGRPGDGAADRPAGVRAAQDGRRRLSAPAGGAGRPRFGDAVGARHAAAHHAAVQGGLRGWDMTEAEWLACADWLSMWEIVRYNPSETQTQAVQLRMLSAHLGLADR